MDSRIRENDEIELAANYLPAFHRISNTKR